MTGIKAMYPEFIKTFSKIDFPDPEIEANVLGGKGGQVAFFDMPEGAEVPIHKHKDSWAIVVSGELVVSIGNKIFNARQGDSWFTPEGTEHGGKALKPTRLLEVFSEKRFHINDLSD